MNQWQQMSEHPLIFIFRPLDFIVDDRFDPPCHGWCQRKQICGEIFCHYSQMIPFSCCLLKRSSFFLPCCTFCFKVLTPKVFYWIEVREHIWSDHSFLSPFSVKTLVWTLHFVWNKVLSSLMLFGSHYIPYLVYELHSQCNLYISFSNAPH